MVQLPVIHGRFNSKMVRLQVAIAELEKRIFYVSIPKWYD